MSRKKFKYEEVTEMQCEDGTPCCWCTKSTTEPFIWITLNYNGKYDVEIKDIEDEFGIKLVATCKTLNGAKRYVRNNYIPA